MIKFSKQLNFCQVIKDGNVITGDLGGRAKCSEYTDEIIKKIESM